MVWNNSSIVTHICLGTWQRHTHDRLTVTLCACVLCAKSLQSCPTLCDPMNYSLSGSCVHGDPPDKNIAVDCHAFLQGIFLTQILCLMHWAGGFFFFFTMSATWEAWKGTLKVIKGKISSHSHICSSHYYNPAPYYRKRHKTALKEYRQETRFRH